MNASLYPVNSTDLLSPVNNNNSPPKFRYKPQRTVLLMHQIRFKQDDDEQKSSRLCKGGLSLDKLSYIKIKQQKQMLENSRLPSFNIKRLIDRSIKKRRQLKDHFSNGTSPTRLTRQKTNQNRKDDLRLYWHQYLKNQTFKIKPTENSRRNQRKHIAAEHSERQIVHEEKEKQMFSTNNFIKTTYRKRKLEKSNLNQQLSLRQRRRALGQGVKSKNSINWMTPWEKGCIQNEQQPFSYT